MNIWVFMKQFNLPSLPNITSSNGNIFRGTGPLWGESTGHRYIPLTKDSPHKGQWLGALMFSLICAWTNGWTNNREARYLKRHSAHYDFTVMTRYFCFNAILFKYNRNNESIKTLLPSDSPYKGPVMWNANSIINTTGLFCLIFYHTQSSLHDNNTHQRDDVKITRTHSNLSENMFEESFTKNGRIVQNIKMRDIICVSVHYVHEMWIERSLHQTLNMYFIKKSRKYWVSLLMSTLVSKFHR